MIATKRKYLVEKTSKELNISTDDVDDVVYSYYNYILKLIKSLEHTRIYVNHVCTFKFRMVKSSAYVEYGNRQVERLRLRRPTDYLLQSITEIETRVNKLKKLIEIAYQEYNIKKTKRKERYEFIKSVASQESDSGRDSE